MIYCWYALLVAVLCSGINARPVQDTGEYLDNELENIVPMNRIWTWKNLDSPGRPVDLKNIEHDYNVGMNKRWGSPKCSKLSTDHRRLERRKRFVVHVTKWQQRDIRWRFRDPFELFQNGTDFIIAKETLSRAFGMWSLASKHAIRFWDVSDEKLNSSNDTENVDIDIFFATGDHGDHEPFDGKGGTVAHSGYPPEGKIHFDGSELWMINGDWGIDLRYVMLHETGHALGLRHSKRKGAIMHPIYKTKSPEIALSHDDIKAIKYLYPVDKPEIGIEHSVNGAQQGWKKSPAIDFEDY